MIKCPYCNEKGTILEASETCVGYISPPGHDHNDNCIIELVQCKNNHQWKISPRRKCSTPGCNWKGQMICFCHEGTKYEAKNERSNR